MVRVRPSVDHRRPHDIPAGWRWLYTRGYDLRAPAGYAFQWMLDHAQFGRLPRPAIPDLVETILELQPWPKVRSVYLSRGVERLTIWEIRPPDRITWHDEVLKSGRAQVLGEERWQFLGSKEPGSIAEVTVLRRPVSLSARLVNWASLKESGRTTEEERAIMDGIDRDFGSA
jgi:hypothetical protein